MKYRELLQLPPNQEKDIQEQSETLDKILQDVEKEYLGTDPVDDSQVIFRKKQMQKFGIVEKDLEDNDDEAKIKKKILKKNRKRAEKEDPFDLYGHGIKSYFRLLKYMILVLSCISLIFIPIMILYARGQAFQD